MAMVIKNTSPNAYREGVGVLNQWIHVKRATSLLPQSTTVNIFQVTGGKVLVKALIGTVTTIIQSSDPVMSISSIAKDNTGTTVGTAVAVGTTTTTASLEAGGMIFVEGDGTAIVLSNAGAAYVGANSGNWIAPQGYIQWITTASKSGAVQWDLFYQPLDETARVVAL